MQLVLFGSRGPGRHYTKVREAASIGDQLLLRGAEVVRLEL